MSPILLWTLIAIVGVLVYMWPVLRRMRREGFQNPYKTIQLANGATLTFQDAEEWRAFQEITGGSLPDTVESETPEQGASENTVTSTSEGPEETEPQDDIADVSEQTSETLTASDRLKLRQMISGIQTVRQFLTQNPSYKFKTTKGGQFVRDMIIRRKIDAALQTILTNGVWGTSRNDKDLQVIIRENAYVPILKDVVAEIEKYKPAGSKGAQSASSTDLNTTPALLTTADRVAIEILKKTLEDIQQRMAKLPTIQFQKPVQTNKLIQDISLLQYKLNEALQKGWGTTRDDVDLKFAVQHNILQTSYDAVLKEIQEAEIKKTENDMKLMMESKTVPDNCEAIKSTPASCKVTRQYIATPSEVQGVIARNACKRPGNKCPDMKDYIHKSKLPDMSQYIRKDSIPCWACKL